MGDETTGLLMACPHCGSWSVRADRSLGGRLVCGRCGRPLQGVKPGRQPSGGRRGLVGGPAFRFPWRLGLLVLVAAAAALAALQPTVQQQQPLPFSRERSLLR
jgi:ribosomal protein S27AE